MNNNKILVNVLFLLIIFLTLSGCSDDKVNVENVISESTTGVVQELKKVDDVVLNDEIKYYKNQIDKEKEDLYKVFNEEKEQIQKEGVVFCEKQLDQLRIENEKYIKEMNDSLIKKLNDSNVESDNKLENEIKRMEGEVDKATKDEIIFLTAEVKRLNALKTCK